ADLESAMKETDELRQYADFLKPDQRLAVDGIHESLEAKTVALAEEAAARLAPEGASLETERVPEIADAAPVKKGPPGTAKILRTVLTPDGRTARFVNQGTVFRVYVEGEPEPVVEYDIADFDLDIPAYNVLRRGHRGVYVNGVVWWEDGQGPA
ncbi:hypothetical protein ACFL2T_06180, partial [Elusimicrobiota bacterium]